MGIVTTIKLLNGAKEIEREIVNRNSFFFIQRRCRVVDLELKYFPLIISEFHCDTEKKKSKKINKAYVIINGSSGKKQAYPDLAALETEELDVDQAKLAECEVDIQEENLQAIKYLKFTVLPKTFHSFQDYEIELLSSRLVYRPVWLVKWQNAKGTEKYTVINGDKYNL